MYNSWKNILKFIIIYKISIQKDNIKIDIPYWNFLLKKGFLSFKNI